MRARIHRVDLSPVVLDPRYGILRSPPRHPFVRQDGYENAYDFFTLFYDLFWSDSGERVTAIGPHLPLTLDLKRDLTISALPSHKRCTFKYRQGKKLQSPCYLSIKAPKGTQALVLSLDEQTWICSIQPNLSPLYKRHIALVTKSRNNDLQWIHDWAFFHVKECGVDTIVFYDNGSTAYDVGDIALALRSVPGLAEVVLVQQDAPFGPPISGGVGDSTYLQVAMLEHARYRFLALADHFINLDIDELLVLKTARRLRSYLHRKEPVVLIDRRNVENAPEQPTGDTGPPGHRNYWWRERDAKPTAPKWIARPRACRAKAVFRTHRVSREQAWQAPAHELEIAHFLALTTGWKVPGRLQEVPRERMPELVEDQDLRERLSRVFGDHHTVCRPWSPLESGEPALQLRWARELVGENRLEDALIVSERTLDIAPDLLGALKLLGQIHERLGNELAAGEVRDRMAQLTLRNPDWYLVRANFCQIRNPATAMHILETAVNQGVVSASLLEQLANLYERTGRLADPAEARSGHGGDAPASGRRAL